MRRGGGGANALRKRGGFHGVKRGSTKMGKTNGGEITMDVHLLLKFENTCDFLLVDVKTISFAFLKF